MRVGLLAKKIGMSSFYSDSGRVVPVTLLQVSSCQVMVQKKIDGKCKLEVGAFDKKVSRVSKPLQGYFAKYKVSPKSKVVEFEVSEDAMLESGCELKVDHFVVGQYLDVTGVSIGKGFAGVMKRHNFSGLRASHGVSISHRAHGSTGQCQDPGKVFKGKKMAGHMGSKKVTKQNIQIMHIDIENNMLVVKGSVPGSKGSVLMVKDAIKRALPANVPYPGVAQTTKNEDNPNKVKESEA